MSDVRILSETRCELGEGPFFCTRRNTLYWFDILSRRRHAHDFSTGFETSIAVPERASAMAVADEAHDVVFTESGLWLRETDTGCWSPLAEIEADNEETRSNDARVHPSGAFWLGTMGLSAQKGAGAIYHWRKGRLTRLFDAITIPNAICFAPDGRTAWFTDTPTGQLMQVATDPDTGLPEGEPQLFVDLGDETGGLDGAICDADGFVWNARWGAGALDRYAPDGSRVASVALPALQTSCPAFAGGGMIAVTSAMEGQNERARSADAHGGKTFLVACNVKPVFEPKLAL